MGESLREQRKFEEAEPLLVEALTIFRNTMNVEPGVLEYAISSLAELYFRENKFSRAEPLYREVLQGRILTENHRAVEAMASLGRLLRDWALAEHQARSQNALPSPASVSRAREAEALLRRCLKVWMDGPKDLNWRTADVRSRLGGSLAVLGVIDPDLTPQARQALFIEAESLLIEGEKGLQHLARKSKYIRDTLAGLVHLYKAWDKPEKAWEWQGKLDAFDQKKLAP